MFETAPPGIVGRMTRMESECLDALRVATVACNAAERFAPGQEERLDALRVGTVACDAEERPYWHASQALRIALVDLFGESIAEAIDSETLNNGESVTYNVRLYFNGQLEITDSE